MHNLEDDRRGTTVPFFYRALGKQLQYHAIYIYIYISEIFTEYSVTIIGFPEVPNIIYIFYRVLCKIPPHISSLHNNAMYNYFSVKIIPSTCSFIQNFSWVKGAYLLTVVWLCKSEKA